MRLCCNSVNIIDFRHHRGPPTRVSLADGLQSVRTSRLDNKIWSRLTLPLYIECLAGRRTGLPRAWGSDKLGRFQKRRR